MPDAFVKFHQVSFSYDAATEALFHDVTFHLAPGWSGVVGANGAGKTTLLKLAAGLLMLSAVRLKSLSRWFIAPSGQMNRRMRFPHSSMAGTKRLPY